MKKAHLFALTLGLAPAALSAQDFNVTPQQQTLIAEIPTSSAATARQLFGELSKDAAVLVPMFAAKLSTEKSDADTTARYALGGLVWTTGHSGTPEQKQQLAKLIADSIAKTTDVEPKSFLIEQLQFMGQPSIADVLYPLMTDKDLGPRAIRTLAALKPEALAEQALTKLSDSNTTEVQAGLLLTLAQLAPANAVAKIAPLVNATDGDVRAAALDALAAIADPSSRDALKQAALATETFEDLLAPARYLDYAKNLAAKDQKDLAAEICREVIAMDLTPANQHLAGLALTTLADIVGEPAADDLLAHVRDDQEDVRATALDNLNRFPSEPMTVHIIRELETSPDPEVTVAILLALGDRKDASALPAVSAKFADENELVATTAVASAGEIDRSKALPAYLDSLTTTTNDNIVKAVIDQMRRVKTEELLPAVAKALPTSNAAGQVALIGLLGERRAVQQKDVIFAATESKNSKVRSAAYDALGRVAEAGDLARLRDMILAADSSATRKSARQAFVVAAKDSGDAATRSRLLLDSFTSANPDGKEVLLETMAALGDKESLQIVIDTASTTAVPELQNAAVRALSEWQSTDVATELARIAQKSPVETHQVLAVRGLSRLAGEIKDAPAKKTEILMQALRLAKRPEEQKTIVSQLGDVKTTDALRAVSPYVDKEGVAAEAAAAAVKIALPGKSDTGIRGPETAETLGRALQAIPDEKKRKEVEKFIYGIIQEINSAPVQLDNEGFAILFNGKDLSGWCGDLDGYSVENGVLVCQKDGGGKLFTEKQYGDYVFRFEFKLEAGGNNGVGIRAPLHGDAAYDGMEVQILDDKDPQYKDIKPWQVHGSVYGISPAQPSDVKIGEWNTEEISVVGRNIKVTVNGKVVSDVNLDEAAKTPFPSGKAHPGTKRNRGHIGFLGHHHKVEFRNVRLKNVANTPPAGYTALFNGENLDGWKGLVANPIKRKAMPADELQKAQAIADAKMQKHWDVNNAILFFDGEGSHMCTTKDYRNFEMLVDWCIPPGGDNGIYLRGTPQVQIWDPRIWPQGSGGLYNNEKNTSNPLVLADNPIGQWNQFRIKMVDDKVTVHLNEKLVVDNVVLENFWDRKLPVAPKEQIELQSHGSPAWFRNVYVKELPD